MVIGPNRACAPIAGIFLLCMFGWVLLTMASVLPSLTLRLIAYTGIGINVIIFIALNFSDPGLPHQLRPGKRSSEYDTLLKDEKRRICKDCEREFNIASDEVYCVEKVTHCKDCGVCVENWDHHCGVFDRCIGSGNLMLFYGVLISFFSNLAFLMVAMAIWGEPVSYT